jgi:hypothetical protein
MTATGEGSGGDAGGATPEEKNTSPALPYHIDAVLSKLREVKPGGAANTWTALCPAHKDKRQSLSVTLADDGRILLKCFSGCAFSKIVAVLGMDAADLAPTPQPKASLTLMEYSTSKRLPLSFLATLGLRETSLGRGRGERAVATPYYSSKGEQIGLRYRLSMTGDARFRWRDGSKASLYGLQRMSKAREAGYILMLEGESDTQTAWLHDLPAIGLPGAGVWREDWCGHFDGIGRICVADERDDGANAIRQWVSKSAIRDRVWFFSLDGLKDVSELHCTDPDGFDARLRAALEAAVPWSEADRQERAAVADGAWQVCQHLAASPDILQEFTAALAATGLAGERQAAQIVYLALTSRVLDRPVSIVIRGPAASGKNFLLDSVLAFFPLGARVELTGLSEHALIYIDTDLAHKCLVIYEAEGVAGDFTQYLLRGLLSKGELVYQTVVKTDEGMQPLTIRRKGPTNVALTTTRPMLNPENETRMLSLGITDSREQTREVFRVLADDGGKPKPPPEAWPKLQEWLTVQGNDVVIPYANALAELVPPAAIRLRRDFGAMLALVQAHALLHQGNRQRDGAGRVLADFDDYAIVADLLSPIISQGIGATVPATIRETVEVVGRLHQDGLVTTLRVAEELNICREAARSRLATAAHRGFVKNLEDKRRRPARWAPADPLPEDQEILPSIERVIEKLAGCTPALQTAPAVNLDAAGGNAGMQVLPERGQANQTQTASPEYVSVTVPPDCITCNLASQEGGGAMA